MSSPPESLAIFLRRKAASDCDSLCDFSRKKRPHYGLAGGRCSTTSPSWPPVTTLCAAQLLHGVCFFAPVLAMLYGIGSVLPCLLSVPVLVWPGIKEWAKCRNITFRVPVLCQKNPRAHKNKIGTPPPPPQNPPPKKGNFADMVFPAERTHFFQVSIKLAHPFPAPELRTRILRTRGFF